MLKCDEMISGVDFFKEMLKKIVSFKCMGHISCWSESNLLVVNMSPLEMMWGNE